MGHCLHIDLLFPHCSHTISQYNVNHLAHARVQRYSLENWNILQANSLKGNRVTRYFGSRDIPAHVELWFLTKFELANKGRRGLNIYITLLGASGLWVIVPNETSLLILIWVMIEIGFDVSAVVTRRHFLLQSSILLLLCRTYGTNQ